MVCSIFKGHETSRKKSLKFNGYIDIKKMVVFVSFSIIKGPASICLQTFSFNW